MEVNVAAAARLGIQALLFENAKQLRWQLAGWRS